MKLSAPARAGVVIGLVSAVLLLFVLTVLTYIGSATTGVFGYFVRNHLLLMILLTVVSLVTGAVLVFVLAREKAVQHKAASGTAQMLLSFLSIDERTVIERLAGTGGSALQSQLGSSLNFSAVRMHRVLLRLQSKRFISLERYGKTNKAILAYELAVALSKETFRQA